MIRTFTLSLLAAAMVVLASPGEASAQQFDPRSRFSADEARDARRAGEVLSASRVLSIVRQRFPGEQVRVVDLINGSRPYYLVRVATRDGRRFDVQVDARTGRILSVR
ncbi:MAG: PepSY domain-containing protein [Pseudomonadota bacterium]